MSQVVCVKDNLADKRKASLKAERRIDTDSGYRKWHKPVSKQGEAAGKILLAAIVGAFMLWLGVGILAVIALLIVVVMSRVIGFLSSLR